MLLALLLAAVLQGPGDVESLTAAADAVVHGQVVGRRSAWTRAGGQIFTTVTLRTLETWKGPASAEVTILVPGGEAGDLAQTVAGAASFQDGEEVVVFLHRSASGVFGVERMALGKFGVESFSPGRVVRDRRGLSCLQCTAAERDELSLDELRARVLGSAQR